MPFDNLTSNTQRLFWVLQLLGWAGWGSTFYLGVLYYGAADSLRYYELYLAAISGVGLVLSLGLRWLHHAMWESPLWQRILAVALGSYAAGFLWMLARSWLFSSVYVEQTSRMELQKEWTLANFFVSAGTATWVMLVWSSLYIGIKYYLISQAEKQRYLKAVSMAQEAQLKMLRYQLNPHFLFNTLNAISTLILDRDTELANSMVTKLSRFLRYSLVNDPMASVTVAEEVASLKLYLDIEKVRFGDRLTLRFSIDSEAERALMPSLLLQPLVENAIKYAISQAIQGGFIAVTASVVGERLILSVADDGPGLDMAVNHGGSGVGLANTRERLLQRYGDVADLQLLPTKPHGVTVQVRLPLEHADSRR